ncbi:hypothetical protein [Arthrobacter tecti]
MSHRSFRGQSDRRSAAQNCAPQRPRPRAQRLYGARAFDFGAQRTPGNNDAGPLPFGSSVTFDGATQRAGSHRCTSLSHA